MTPFVKERLIPILKVGERLLPYVLTAAYATGLVLMLAHHEMWRDETQAWLLARDSTSPLALLQNMRYEGHPGLWHLLLWGPAQLTANPIAMQVIHGLLATATAFVVLRLAPFHWPTRILLVCSYFLAYEWAVISRNYAISSLLFFLFAALHRQRWRWFPVQAIVAFALCHTNIHSLILVLVLLPMVAIEYAVAYAGNQRDARARLAAVCLGVGIIVIGLATGIRQISPPSDSGYAQKWNFTWKAATAQYTARHMMEAYAPLPREEAEFWESNRFNDKIERDQYIAVAVMIAAATSLLFLCQPWPILPYIGGSLALLTFFYVKYGGSIRHHGFLFLLPIVLLWMSWDYRPWSLPWRWANRPLHLLHRFRDIPLMALLVIHVQGTLVAARVDWQNPFSMSKATADWIRANVPDWQEIIVAGFGASATSAVAAHLQLPQIFYPERDDYGSYVIWDKPSRATAWRIGSNLDACIAEEGKDILLVTSRKAGKRDLPKQAKLLHTVTGPATTESTYHLYRCPAQKPPFNDLSTPPPRRWLRSVNRFGP